MDVVFGVFLIIVFLFIVMRPVLQRWFAPMLQRWMMGKVEDRMRRMAGMPTRKEERKARKNAQRREHGGAERFRKAAQGRRSYSRHTGRSSTDMLQTFAEDVEFTEIKEFSSEIEIGTSDKKTRDHFTTEEQIEDAEYTEVKFSQERK